MEEKTEDLQIGGLKIIQGDDGFKFGTDAVLLAWFGRRKKYEDAVDLCTGNGIVPLLLSLTGKGRVTGLELQAKQQDRFLRSIALNGLEDRLTALQGDVREIVPGKTPLRKAGYDLVTVNPPYFESGRGLAPSETKAAARRDTECTLEDVTQAAGYLLRFGGRLCMIHKPERLPDLFEAFRKAGIEPKELLPVISVPGKKPELVLIEGRKGGGRSLSFLAPLILHTPAGDYTEEACALYGFDKNKTKE